MLKSTHTNTKPVSKKEYPCLKRYHKDGNDFVVLFTDKKTGTCVSVNETGNSWGFRFVGEHLDTWAEDQFTLYTGTVTITA